MVPRPPCARWRKLLRQLIPGPLGEAKKASPPLKETRSAWRKPAAVAGLCLRAPVPKNPPPYRSAIIGEPRTEFLRSTEACAFDCTAQPRAWRHVFASVADRITPPPASAHGPAF